MSIHRNTVYVVTGGAGFIGSHLVRALVKEGATVRVIDDLRAGDASRLPEGVALHKVSIEQEVDPALYDGADAVFHLAAIPGVQTSIDDPISTHDVNVTGTLNVLESARAAGVRRIIFASSAAVYGDHEEPVLSEVFEARPMSPYAFHKYTGEQMLRTWSMVYGIEAVSLRYFNVYGADMDPQGPYAAVIGKFLHLHAAGEVLPITGDGTQTRDFVHVDDIVQANMRAVHATHLGTGDVCNVGTGVGVSINDIAAMIGGETRHIPARLELKHAVADITRARELLGYAPTVSIADGLAALQEGKRASVS